MSIFKNKNVLVTGGTGLIGTPLVEELSKLGANIKVVSLDKPPLENNNIEYINKDLRIFDNCMDVCRDMFAVFSLAGVKGSPAMTNQRPASFFVPTITFSINMMEAARRCRVERYLFTSSIGVYAPAEVFYEDSVWKTFPSPNDRFAGWAKRMGELQAEAYAIEYGWDKISIVRPANVYGPKDNFDPNNAMVIPSLIRRAIDGENPLTVWGDGSPIRDFIYAKDVALGMIKVMEIGYNKPINLGSGKETSIREIVDIIKSIIGDDLKIEWDVSKPSGDKKRLMDMTRQNEIGIMPRISLEQGIKETIEWYKNNKSIISDRYNPFTEKDLQPEK
tara:strand:+ start:401 stop:1399 length:999 start_codon:yes stop_codon:yes gene_type:complete